MTELHAAGLEAGYSLAALYKYGTIENNKELEDLNLKSFVNDKNASDTRPNRGRDISDGVVCSWRRWR